MGYTYGFAVKFLVNLLKKQYALTKCYNLYSDTQIGLQHYVQYIFRQVQFILIHNIECLSCFINIKIFYVDTFNMLYVSSHVGIEILHVDTSNISCFFSIFNIELLHVDTSNIKCFFLIVDIEMLHVDTSNL